MYANFQLNVSGQEAHQVIKKRVFFAKIAKKCFAINNQSVDFFAWKENIFIGFIQSEFLYIL